MRIAVDLQSCLTDSRNRGIGRYSMSLATELARAALPGDDVFFGMDASMPESLRDLRARLRLDGIPGRAPATCYPHTSATELSPLTKRAARLLRSRFYSCCEPDVLLVTSFFEYGAPLCSALDRDAMPGVTRAVVAYDVIPLLFPGHYLPDGNVMTDWYREKVEEFKQFDLFLAISESTRNDLIEHMGIEPARVRVIGAGLDVCLAGFEEDEVDRLSPLGIRSPFVLMVGNADWRKNSIGALHAYAALPKELQDRFQLVFTQVGDDVREALTGRYKRLQNRVKLVGKVCERTLAQLYRKCDVFFFPSFYEGFGLPVLEAMALGAPVLSSNGGALPEVIHDPRALFDPRDHDATAAALRRALDDQAFREMLRTGAKEHAHSFAWRDCALRAREAMKDFAPAPSGRIRQVEWEPSSADISAMADACIASGPKGDLQLSQGLESIAAGGRRRILVDLTEVVRLDARSGIQRVVRNYFIGLAAAALQDDLGEVEPIHWTERGFVHARKYAREHLGVDCAGEDETVSVRPGDLLFMLDSSWWSPERFTPLYDAVHGAGGEVVWMVYDLIPINHPECCDAGMPRAFRLWLEHAMERTDGVVCISDATRTDLEAFIDTVKRPVSSRPWTMSLHLGSDLESGRVQSPSANVAAIVDGLQGVPWLAALGTLEPRKDHQTILAACERLWAKGTDIALVIIGKKGWNVEELAKRIRSHPELGTRLFWLEGLDDGDVRHLLTHCSALVQASIAEGFGLPIVEAGSLGIPLLLTDLPVFREVAGDEAIYFPVCDDAGLALAIKAGIANGWRRPAGIRTMTWKESSEALRKALLLNIKPR